MPKAAVWRCAEDEREQEDGRPQAFEARAPLNRRCGHDPPPTWPLASESEELGALDGLGGAGGIFAFAARELGGGAVGGGLVAGGERVVAGFLLTPLPHGGGA